MYISITNIVIRLIGSVDLDEMKKIKSTHKIRQDKNMMIKGSVIKALFSAPVGRNKENAN